MQRLAKTGKRRAAVDEYALFKEGCAQKRAVSLKSTQVDQWSVSFVA
jgi:hypothetical protein